MTETKNHLAAVTSPGFGVALFTAQTLAFSAVLSPIGETRDTCGFIMSTRSGLGMCLDGTALAWCEAWGFRPQPCKIDT